MEPQTIEFWNWFKDKTPKYKLLATVFAAVSVATSFVIGLSENLESYGIDKQEEKLALAAFVQVFLLFIFAVAKIRTKHFNEKPAKGDAEEKVMKFCGSSARNWITAQENANKAVDQFENIFRYLFATWVLLYCVLGAYYLHQSGLPPDTVNLKSHSYIVAIVAIGNISTALLIGWFVVMAKVTTGGNGYRSVTITLVMSIVLLTFLHFGILSNHIDGIDPSPEGSFFVNQAWLNAPSWLAGVFAAMAFALVVGRLDSKYINTPTFVLILLYLYAAIQPLFILLSSRQYPEVALFLVLLALGFKMVLYISVVWILERGRLVLYFARIRRLHDNVEKEIGVFRSIRLMEQ